MVYTMTYRDIFQAQHDGEKPLLFSSLLPTVLTLLAVPLIYILIVSGTLGKTVPGYAFDGAFTKIFQRHFSPAETKS
jgi:hypothetical protein